LIPRRSRPHDEALAARIPKRKPEHAIQPVDELVAVLRVKMDDDFAVGSSLELMTERLKLLTQLAEVVDLPVANQPQRAIDVGQWLVPARKVDDRQAPHADCARRVDVHCLRRRDRDAQ
jgi:hypothetical protein